VIRLVKHSPVFPTLQGEGVLTGVPSTFLRLAGCDLRCNRHLAVPGHEVAGYTGWDCDTPHSLPDYNPRSLAFLPEPTRFAIDHPVPYVIEMIERHHPTHLVVTGGEPTLQNERLVELLTGLRNWRALLGVPRPHVTLETNGRHYSANLDALVDLVSVSPKVYQTGATDIDQYALWCNAAGQLQVKIVVSDLAVQAVELAFSLFDLARSVRKDAVLFVQRADTNSTADEASVVHWVSNDPQLRELGVRYGIQAHKVIGIP